MESRNAAQTLDDRRGKPDMEPGGANRASGSQPKQDGPQQTLQFVNTTGSVTLDEASRMEVRSQVMRDWHRRKKQRSIGKEAAARGVEHAGLTPATTTSKTGSHRLRLLPLLPRSHAPSGPRINSKDDLYENAFVATVPAPQDGQVMQNMSSMGNQVPCADNLQSEGAQAAEQKWLFTLEHFLQTDTLHNVPSSGVLDPFNAMSLLITPRTQRLLHYYFKDCLQSAWLLIPVCKAYFSLAIHDEAFLHTCLAYFAGRYSAQFRSGDPVESLQHRMEAIRILNSRMGDDVQSLTDCTIGAVANLALYEAANGSPHTMDTHMKGLHKMISMRGGLDRVHPYIQRLIAWADLNASNVTSKTPSLPLIDHWLTQTPNQVPITPQGTHKTPTITFDQLAATSTLDTLFDALRLLTFTLQQIYSRNLSQQHDIRTSDQLYYSQARLFALCCHSYRGNQPLITSTTVAMIIYSHYCLRDTSLAFRIIGLLARNLKIELSKIPDEALLTGEYSRRSPWVLALGAIAAEGRTERSWFVPAFKRVVDAQGLGSWQEVKRALEDVLWTKELDELGAGLWAETQAGWSCPG